MSVNTEVSDSKDARQALVFSSKLLLKQIEDYEITGKVSSDLIAASLTALKCYQNELYFPTYDGVGKDDVGSWIHGFTKDKHRDWCSDAMKQTMALRMDRYRLLVTVSDKIIDAVHRFFEYGPEMEQSFHGPFLLALKTHIRSVITRYSEGG